MLNSHMLNSSMLDDAPLVALPSRVVPDPERSTIVPVNGPDPTRSTIEKAA